MDDEFHRLRQLFVEGLSKRQERIEAALEDLDQMLDSSQKLQDIALLDLYKEIHNLAGAAGGYQFAQLSHKSRNLEQQLRLLQGQELGSVSRHEWQQFSKEVEALLLLIQQERQTV
jgi:HPt (histidine-containing phosphotransfer) domain-containing protein